MSTGTVFCECYGISYSRCYVNVFTGNNYLAYLKSTCMCLRNMGTKYTCCPIFYSTLEGPGTFLGSLFVLGQSSHVVLQLHLHGSTNDLI